MDIIIVKLEIQRKGNPLFMFEKTYQLTKR